MLGVVGEGEDERDGEGCVRLSPSSDVWGQMDRTKPPLGLTKNRGPRWYLWTHVQSPPVLGWASPRLATIRFLPWSSSVSGRNLLLQGLTAS